MTTPTGILFYEPRAKPLSTIGAIQPGAYYQFYLTGTTTPSTVYGDGTLTTPLSQTPGTGQTTAAADGRLVPIYLNPNVVYRVQLYSATNVLLEDVDPYLPIYSPTSTQAQIGQTLWPQTTAEQAAGVTPVNYAYPPWDVRRMGVTGDGTTDDTVALQKCFTVGGDWFIPYYMQVRCTATITGIVGTRLYSNSSGPIGLGTLSSTLPQAYLVHDFSGTFFDLIGSASSNLISAGFSFERLTFVQKNGNGTGASGSCIRSVQVSNTQKCTWIRMTDCNIELLSGSVNDWTHGIELDGTVVANPNNLRDLFFSRIRIVSGSNATDSISFKGVANAFLHNVETNLSNGNFTITGGGGNSSINIFITGSTFNNIALDLATGVYGAGNTASTVTSTANTLNVNLGCSCTGSTPTIAGTRVYIWGLHSTGKLTTSANANVRMEIGSNIFECSGPVASGTNPASTGDVRLSNNGAGIVARNAANSADVTIASVNGSNAVALGNASTAMGFYGTAGVTKATLTGAKGGNVALTNLITLLATLGLLTDSTT